MTYLSDWWLDDAERECRFVPHQLQYYTVKISWPTVADFAMHSDEAEFLEYRTEASEARSSISTHDSPMSTESSAHELSLLKLVFQPHRPQHVSGRSDKLPFRNRNALQRTFNVLHLPYSYLHVADGFPTLVQCDFCLDDNGKPLRCNFIVHCVQKQGDWALALSHDTKSMRTTAFWSVEGSKGIIQADRLVDTLKTLRKFSIHPMLIPCIMFNETLRLGIKRRNDTKMKINAIEARLRALEAADLAAAQTEPHDDRTNLASLFQILLECRREQQSSEGRYELWKSFRTALAEGMDYFELTIPQIHHGPSAQAHADLKLWASMISLRLESLKACDIDHISRIDNVSDMVGPKSESLNFP